MAPVHVDEVDDQRQPYWLLAQADEVVSCEQGVTVPVQGIVPADQTQPFWPVQSVDVASWLHAVNVPVQVAVGEDQ
jgi:hypothetical protein